MGMSEFEKIDVCRKTWCIGMDDLISRKAVRDGMMKYGFHAPDMTVHEFVEDELPAVEAVPLEPLCKWLSTVTAEAPCSDDCEECEAFTGDGDIAVCWERAIKKWMEEQHEPN